MTRNKEAALGATRAGAAVLFSTRNTAPFYHKNAPIVKPVVHLLELAAVPWQACRVGGDHGGAVVWRKRFWAHRAVAWSATHLPDPEPLEVIHDR